MKAYTLISKNGNQSTFTFNEAQQLIEFKADAAMSSDALTWLLERLPVKYAELTEMAEKLKVQLIEVQLDLSFEKFWIEYDYKIGNKPRAKKLWEGLSETTRSIVLQSIPKYKRYLKVKTGIEQTYPETYLSQSRYESDFKA